MKSPNKLALTLLCGVLAVNSVVAMDQVANMGFDAMGQAVPAVIQTVVADDSFVAGEATRAFVAETAQQVAQADWGQAVPAVVQTVVADDSFIAGEATRTFVAETAQQVAQADWGQAARNFGSSIANGLSSAGSSVANSAVGQWVQEHPYITAGAVVGAAGAVYGVRRYRQSAPTEQTTAADTATSEEGQPTTVAGQVIATVKNNPKKTAFGIGLVGALGAAAYNREAVRSGAVALYNALPSRETMQTVAGNVASSVWNRVPEQTPRVIAAEVATVAAVGGTVATVNYRRRRAQEQQALDLARQMGQDFNTAASERLARDLQAQFDAEAVVGRRAARLRQEQEDRDFAYALSLMDENVQSTNMTERSVLYGLAVGRRDSAQIARDEAIARSLENESSFGRQDTAQIAEDEAFARSLENEQAPARQQTPARRGNIFRRVVRG